MVFIWCMLETGSQLDWASRQIFYKLTSVNWDLYIFFCRKWPYVLLGIWLYLAYLGWRLRSACLLSFMVIIVLWPNFLCQNYLLIFQNSSIMHSWVKYVFNWTDRCNSLVQGKIIAKIVNIHNNFKVLLQNNWTIFIQTWHKASILVQREFKQISQTGGNEYIFEFRMVPFDISLWTKVLVKR